MASRHELELARRALNRLSASALTDVLTLLAGGDLAVIEDVYPDVIAEYGRAAGALGADMVETWAEDLGVRPTLSLDRPVPAGALGMLRWAATQPDPTTSLAESTDMLVKQPYRRTVQDSAHASGVGWARVPTGAKTCAFCLMTASRGAVYKSSGSAGGDHKYHGGCDCQVVMVASANDYPEGYDPEGLGEVYAQARRNVEGKPTTKAILAEIRQITGGN